MDIQVVDLYSAARDFDKLYGRDAVELAGHESFQVLVCCLVALVAPVERGWVVVLGQLGRFGDKMGHLSYIALFFIADVILLYHTIRYNIIPDHFSMPPAAASEEKENPGA